MHFKQSDFHSFKTVIQSDLLPGDIFDQSLEQVAIKAFTLLLHVKGEITNEKFIHLY